MFKKDINTFHETVMYSLCIVRTRTIRAAMKTMTRPLGMARNWGIHGLRTYYYVSFPQASYAHIPGIISHQHYFPGDHAVYVLLGSPLPTVLPPAMHN